MGCEPQHKFQEDIPISYEQHFRAIYTNFIDFVRSLEGNLGREKVKEYLMAWGERRGVEMAGNRRIATFSEFKDFWKEASESDYFQHTTTVKFTEESDSVLQCKYTECLWAKMFRELGASDIGKLILCDPDFTFASTLNPKLKLERSKTLMEGDDCCNHRYTWLE